MARKSPDLTIGARFIPDSTARPTSELHIPLQNPGKTASRVAANSHLPASPANVSAPAGRYGFRISLMH